MVTGAKGVKVYVVGGLRVKMVTFGPRGAESAVTYLACISDCEIPDQTVFDGLKDFSYCIIIVDTK